jgi:hypothetical protein
VQSRTGSREERRPSSRGRTPQDDSSRANTRRNSISRDGGDDQQRPPSSASTFTSSPPPAAMEPQQRPYSRHRRRSWAALTDWPARFTAEHAALQLRIYLAAARLAPSTGDYRAAMDGAAHYAELVMSLQRAGGDLPAAAPDAASTSESADATSSASSSSSLPPPWRALMEQLSAGAVLASPGAQASVLPPQALLPVAVIADTIAALELWPQAGPTSPTDERRDDDATASMCVPLSLLRLAALCGGRLSVRERALAYAALLAATSRLAPHPTITDAPAVEGGDGALNETLATLLRLFASDATRPSAATEVAVPLPAASTANGARPTTAASAKTARPATTTSPTPKAAASGKATATSVSDAPATPSIVGSRPVASFPRAWAADLAPALHAGAAVSTAVDDSRRHHWYPLAAALGSICGNSGADEATVAVLGPVMIEARRQAGAAGDEETAAYVGTLLRCPPFAASPLPGATLDGATSAVGASPLVASSPPSPSPSAYPSSCWDGLIHSGGSSGVDDVDCPQSSASLRLRSAAHAAALLFNALDATAARVSGSTLPPAPSASQLAALETALREHSSALSGIGRAAGHHLPLAVALDVATVHAAHGAVAAWLRCAGGSAALPGAFGSGGDDDIADAEFARAASVLASAGRGAPVLARSLSIAIAHARHLLYLAMRCDINGGHVDASREELLRRTVDVLRAALARGDVGDATGWGRDASSAPIEAAAHRLLAAAAMCLAEESDQRRFEEDVASLSALPPCDPSARYLWVCDKALRTPPQADPALVDLATDAQGALAGYRAFHCYRACIAAAAAHPHLDASQVLTPFERDADGAVGVAVVRRQWDPALFPPPSVPACIVDWQPAPDPAAAGSITEATQSSATVVGAHGAAAKGDGGKKKPSSSLAKAAPPTKKASAGGPGGATPTPSETIAVTQQRLSEAELIAGTLTWMGAELGSAVAASSSAAALARTDGADGRPAVAPQASISTTAALTTALHEASCDAAASREWVLLGLYCDALVRYVGLSRSALTATAAALRLACVALQRVPGRVDNGAVARCRPAAACWPSAGLPALLRRTHRHGDCGSQRA